MKKLIVIIIALLGLQSCLTVGRIERNCDKFTKVCRTDKVVMTKYRDTTITVHDTISVTLPKDTLRIRDTVYVDKETHLANMDTVSKSFGIITAEAWINRSRFGMNAFLNDSTIPFKYDNSFLLPNALSDQQTTQTITVRVKYIPKFYKFTFWVFILLAFAGVLYLAIRLKTFTLFKP